ncbi:MAG: co-chaperone GroES [Planctomycetes bacterium]|nr:co-chaperone GroES [Planctomycetota bacterium]
MAKTAKKKRAKIAFTPIEDRLLIQPAEGETVSAGGIFLPDSAKETPTRGTVVAAGPGRLGKDGKRLEMPVAAGDEVIYGKYAGSNVEIGGTEFKVLRADEVLAKLER